MMAIKIKVINERESGPNIISICKVDSKLFQTQKSYIQEIIYTSNGAKIEMSYRHTSVKILTWC